MRGRWWLAVTVAAISMTAVPASAGGSEPFFSEYLEGRGSSKALEVFNPSGQALSLDGLDVQMFFNGSTKAGQTIPLEGEIPARGTFVVAHPSSAADVVAAADLTWGGSWFNGDDAVVLRRDGEIIDAIGRIGEDPGTAWGAGAASTADATLRRKPAVNDGDRDAYDAFDPALGWDGFPPDLAGGLGSHASDGPFVARPAPDIATLEGGTVEVSGAFAHPAGAPLAIGCTCAGLTDHGDGSWSYVGDSEDGPATSAITVTATGPAGGVAHDTFTVSVENALPTVGAIEGLEDAVPTGAPVQARAPFEDPGTRDTHEATWRWGDSSESQGTAAGGVARGEHSYAAAGLYEVAVTVADDDGGSASSSHEHAVVYDPSAGSLSGGGRFGSGDGLAVDAAYRTKSALGGGILLSVGDLEVVAPQLSWLVVSGPRAYLRGTGVAVGRGPVDVLLAVSDGSRVPGGDADRIRVLVGSGEEILYDTQPGDPLDTAPRLHLTEGDLRIRPCSGPACSAGPGGATMPRTLPAPHGGPCRPQEVACGNTRSWSSSTPTPTSRR